MAEEKPDSSRSGAWRIVVAGGGIPALAFALAVRGAVGPRIDLVVCDPALGRGPNRDKRRDLRAFAIAAGAKRMLEAIGVWEAVAAGAQPIHDMVVTDSRLHDPVRPVFLTFDGRVGSEPFAHMVESGALAGALIEACRAAEVPLKAAAISAVEPGDRAVAVLAGGARLAADLVVAADGARSRLREAAGIGWVGWDYPQSGLVATIGHERDHHGRAVEHFLPSGPFAILPLTPGPPRGHRSSIVWTESRESAAALLQRSPEVILEEIERRFRLQLGPIELDGPVQAFPLAAGIARRLVAPRLALLGEAARVIHPLAGQGLNLGLRDAAALAEEVVGAARLGLDPGSAAVLAAYERARRWDSVVMGAMTDGLNRLFSNDALPVRLARDLGLGVVDRLPALKRFLIGEAAGIRSNGPRLMRGEAL